MTEDLHGDSRVHVKIGEKDPQVRRASCTVILRTPRLGDPKVVEADEVARLDRRAVSSGEDQVRASAMSGRPWLAPRPAQRGADAAQRRRSRAAATSCQILLSSSRRWRSWPRTRCICRPIVSSAASKSMSSQVSPSTSPLRKREYEDQDVGGIERVVVGAGRLEEASSFFARPCVALCFRMGGSLNNAAALRVTSSSDIAWTVPTGGLCVCRRGSVWRVPDGSICRWRSIVACLACGWRLCPGRSIGRTGVPG